MERMTKIYPSGAWGITGELDDAILRLAAIEDILGDNYDLDRLRELVEADRDGRCVVLPVPLHSVLLDMSDICRPDVLKDFRISATWTHNGIVFCCPWNIFNQNIEKGYILLYTNGLQTKIVFRKAFVFPFQNYLLHGTKRERFLKLQKLLSQTKYTTYDLT